MVYLHTETGPCYRERERERAAHLVRASGLFGLGVICVLVLLCSSAYAVPVVPGKTVSTYANVSEPATLTFDPAGVLYVGNDDNDAPVKIYRVSTAGVVTMYGSIGLTDPDAVAFDAGGTISGIAGSVLVGGGGAGPSIYISAIHPDESISTIFSAGVAFNNPTDMAWDSTGRLLFVDPSPNRVFATTGDNPTAIITPPGTSYCIAVGPSDEIYVSTNAGRICRYQSDGTLIDDVFAQDLITGDSARMAFGPGGTWGTDLYTISDGNLLRIDSAKNTMVVGSGFDYNYSDMAFGPDGCLYIGSPSEGAILQITPEPATLSLLLLGGMAILRRRGRRT
jgi:hypothetical protein